ncbi:MAG: indolepyruvate ferredoxin oxidoreductase subunit alpha [Alphaproteobacteria bacterium]
MERSFAKEVQSLKLGEGETFEGEGILAVTKAALQAGVSYVGGYQGSPVSHLVDVLSEAKEIMDEYGVHLEICANEAGAAAMLGASINYPIRGLVTWKSVVGTNVASDALSNLGSVGVVGGAVAVIGEDYGEGASIIQERSHAFAMKSSIWLMDPRPNLTTMVDTVEKAFELSEASNAPVMVMLRILACHVQGRFTARDNKMPKISRRNKLQTPDHNLMRIALPPNTYAQEKNKFEQRMPAAKRFIVEQGLNETFDGDMEDVGIITQGGLYNTVLRALDRVGLADLYGTSRVPIHVLNVTYPLVDEQLAEFCAGKKHVLVVEEGNPEYIEEHINSALRKADIQAVVHGKNVLPMAGQYTAEVVQTGVAKWVELVAPEGADTDRAGAVPEEMFTINGKAVAHLGNPVPPRPPTFCTGCPERPVFSAIKLMERELGPTHISCDIGCHTFSALAPFNLGNTVLGYGLGLASSTGIAPSFGKRVISVMGDGGFWHNGMTTGVASSIFNKDDSVLIVMKNGYTSATGWQFLPSSPNKGNFEDSKMSIERALRTLGVKWQRKVRTYNVSKMVKTLKEAMTTAQDGLKVIIAESECMLAKQRRVKAERAERLKAGKRDVRPRFGIDDDVCTGDHSCIRLSGCPSLTIKPSTDMLRTDPKAHVNQGCVGCGLCGEVSHAAILCPSFYKAEIVSNPSKLELWLSGIRQKVITAWLTPEAVRLNGVHEGEAAEPADAQKAA